MVSTIAACRYAASIHMVTAKRIFDIPYPKGLVVFSYRRPVLKSHEKSLNSARYYPHARYSSSSRLRDTYNRGSRHTVYVFFP